MLAAALSILRMEVIELIFSGYDLDNRQRARVVGRICMDQMMVDVTDIPNVKAGDEVTLMGSDGAETITPDELGSWSDTIGYEVLLAATERVRRVWLHEHE